MSLLVYIVCCPSVFSKLSVGKVSWKDVGSAFQSSFGRMWGALALPVLQRAAAAVAAVSLAPVSVPSVPMAAFQ